MVVVFMGLFFLSLSMVELESLCFFMSVYVDSSEAWSVSQNGA